MPDRLPLPPFTPGTAAQKARKAEDAWNTRDPERVSLAYTEDPFKWRFRQEELARAFFSRREQSDPPVAAKDSLGTILRRTVWKRDRQLGMWFGWGRLGPTAAFLVVFAFAQSAWSAPADKAETPFIAANQAAMSRMMDGMTIKPTGEVDVDFAAMMIPHHQGAIEMAEAELRYGHNEQLLRIAQEIIVDQQQEIAAMRFALGQPLPPSLPSPSDAAGDVHPLSDAMPATSGHTTTRTRAP